MKKAIVLSVALLVILGSTTTVQAVHEGPPCDKLSESHVVGLISAKSDEPERIWVTYYFYFNPASILIYVTDYTEYIGVEGFEDLEFRDRVSVVFDTDKEDGKHYARSITVQHANSPGFE